MNRILRDSTNSVFILHFHGLLPHLYGLQPCYSKWSQLSRSISFTWKNCRTLRSLSIPDMNQNFHFNMGPLPKCIQLRFENHWFIRCECLIMLMNHTWFCLLVFMYRDLKKIMVSSKQENKLILSSTDDRSTHWPWTSFLFKVCLFCFRDDLNCPHPSSLDLSFS